MFEFYLVSDPRLIQEILVTQHKSFIKGEFLQRTKKVFGEGLLTSEGDFHHRQRRLVQPAFHSTRIASYVDTINGYTDHVTGAWKEGQVLDLHSEMTKLTMEVIAKCMFNEDVESQASEISRSLTDIIEYFSRLSSPFAWLLEKLPSNRKYENAIKTVDKMIYGMIADRKKSGRDYGDLLSMLLSARDADGSMMTDQQLRDEALILFSAGHETTANALTWTWYLVSKHPEVEEKLHEEVDSLLQGKRNPNYEDIPKLGYTTKVFTESMRVFPPAWVLPRQPIEDCNIGGYLIPANVQVLMSQYVVHHDPRYFAEPENFNPDRWTKDMTSKLPKFAYFPFGGGPRSCVGEPFAWMEGVLVLARIASGWKMSLDPKQKVELLPRITLRPKYGMRMKLSKRN